MNRSLFTLTSGFTKFTFFQGFWPSGEEEAELISAALSSALSSPSPPPVKVIRDRGREDSQWVQFAAALAEDGILGLEENYFFAQPTCVVVGNIIAHSPSLLRMVARHFSLHMLPQELVLRKGIECYFYFGNYGYTKRGIHRDDQHVFIVNTGRNDKKLWTWDECDDGGLDPSSNDTPFAMDNCIYNILRPGDMAFIPRGCYHLLRSDVYTSMLGLTVFDLRPDNECPLSEASQLLESNGYFKDCLHPKKSSYLGRHARFALADSQLTHTCIDGACRIISHGRKIELPVNALTTALIQRLRKPGWIEAYTLPEYDRYATFYAGLLAKLEAFHIITLFTNPD